MKPIQRIHGVVAVLDRANVDTDQIIAKQFLKSIKRTGFGEFLFYDWRHLPDGKPNPDFALNDPKFQNAKILVARNNFGCGSSREHAVWAVQQYGFDAVIAPSKQTENIKVPGFADIFRSNSFKNALLAIELSEQDVDQIFSAVSKDKGTQASIDLPRQIFTLHSKPELTFSFALDASIKERLLKGLDDIGISMQYESAVKTFEQKHNPQLKKA